MASATITWQSATGFDGRELFYGIEGIATNLPETGIGWTPFSGNPIAPNTNSVVVEGLDDNTKYRFLVRTNCAEEKGLFTETSQIKFICPVIAASDIVDGNMGYSIVTPSSLLTSTTQVKKLTLTLEGINQINGAKVVKEKVYTAPFISSYSGLFTDVEGGVDWLLKVCYESTNFPIYECPSTSFATEATTGDKTITFRNGLSQYQITDIYIDGSQILTELLKSGISANKEITYLGSHPQGQHISVTIPYMIVGTQLTFKHIRNGVAITTGNFTYSGSASLISAALIQLNPNDIIQIASGNTTGIVPKQSIIKKITSPNSYDLQVKIDLPQGVSQTYSLIFTEKDYGSGESNIYTSTLTIPSGQTASDIVHVTSLLPSSAFTRATYQITSLTCNRSSIEIPY